MRKQTDQLSGKSLNLFSNLMKLLTSSSSVLKDTIMKMED